MRQAKLWKTCLTVSAVLICLLLGLALLSVETAESPASPQGEPQLSQEQPAPIIVQSPDKVDSSYTVRVLHGESVEEMPMNRYLQGVVRAEMPAAFAEEALCAQAVAARTYTLYKMMTETKHPQADICTEASCCQAYLSEEEAAEKWGMDAAYNEERICAAVSATDGQTMVYEGVPILAVFHASSPGQTRRAGEVWSNDLPYLQSVSSPENGTLIPDYYSRVEIECDAFRKAFLKVHPEAVLTGEPTGWISGLTTSEESAHVDTVTVGGVTVRGVEIRQIYGLRSAAFDMEVKDDRVCFFVTGYGHGVGMSQYGAHEMAEHGADWKEILMHYYTGIRFEVRGR